LQHQSDLVVLDRIRQTVAADQKGVARLDRVRPFQVHLDRGIGTERARNDVFGDIGGHFAVGQLARRLQFPHETVVKSQLLDTAASETVDPAIAYMGYQGADGQ